MSADDLSLIDAAAEGCKAGRRGQGPSLNPYQDGTPEYDTWEKARVLVVGMLLNGTIRAAREVC